MAVGAFVVALLSTRQFAFFAGDDASNEFLPYMHEMGRMWQSGDLPLLVLNSFSGGNLLIDFGRGPFHPITVICSLLTLWLSDVAVSEVFAWMVISLAVLGGYVLARQLPITRFWSIVGALTLGLAPTFVLVYSAAWWNAAVGTVTLIWAVALLIRATIRPQLHNLLLLGLGTALLACSGWPHSLVAFAVIALVTAGWVLLDRGFVDAAWGRWERIIRVGAALVLGILVAIPQLSEYMASSSLLARDAQLTNIWNLGVPSWGQVLGTAFPMSYDFWDIWGGSIYWEIPIGFVSVLVLFAIGFLRWDARLLGDSRLRWSLVLFALFAVLTQLPAEFGPLLYPFRFLPIGAIFATLAMCLAFSLGEFVWSRRRAVVVSAVFAVGALMYTWRLDEPLSGATLQLIANVLMVALVVGAAFLLKRVASRRIVLASVALAATVFTFFTTTPFAANYAIPAAYPKESIEDVPFPTASDGFVLHTSPDLSHGNDVWPGRFSARYLADGAAIFNGYDPVPRSALVELGGFRNQGTVPSETIEFFAERGEITEGCRFTDYRIAWVVTSSDATDGHHSALLGCGFEHVASEGQTAVFRQELPSTGGTFSTASSGIEVRDNVLASPISESVQVTAGDADGVVHFARLWWPGYSASLGGDPLEVSATDDLLVTVHVPAGSDGVVELSYWPSSWRWALPLAALAAVALLALVVVTGLRDRRRFGFD